MICVDQFFNNLSGGLLSEVIDIQPPPLLPPSTPYLLMAYYMFWLA